MMRQRAIEWTWTWSGHCFGYWRQAELWTHSGKHVGRRTGNEIFSPMGLYLGEVMPNERLITNNAKTEHKSIIYIPQAVRVSQDIQVKISALALSMGYQDFPHPDLF